MTKPSPDTTAPPPVFDLRALRDAVGDDDKLVRFVLVTWIDSEPAWSAELRAALTAGDAAGAAMTAHPFKSASRWIGAHALAQLCTDIEADARSQGPLDAPRYLEAFEAVLPPTLSAVAGALARLQPVDGQAT